MFKNYKKRCEVYKIETNMLREKIEELEKKLDKAERLESIFDKLFSSIDGCLNLVGGLDISKGMFNTLNVKTVNGGEPAVYINDLFGDKVIRQESYKAILIDKEGNVTEGRTKLQPLNNKNYVLREES